MQLSKIMQQIFLEELERELTQMDSVFIQQQVATPTNIQ
jgi:hypothetical protein